MNIPNGCQSRLRLACRTMLLVLSAQILLLQCLRGLHACVPTSLLAATPLCILVVILIDGAPCVFFSMHVLSNPVFLQDFVR
jgi:hypothetical protein